MVSSRYNGGRADRLYKQSPSRELVSRAHNKTVNRSTYSRGSYMGSQPSPPGYAKRYVAKCVGANMSTLADFNKEIKKPGREICQGTPTFVHHRLVT